MSEGYRRYCYCEIISNYPGEIYDPFYQYNYWGYNGTYYDYFNQDLSTAEDTIDWYGNTTTFDVRNKKPPENKSKSPSKTPTKKVSTSKTNATKIRFN